MLHNVIIFLLQGGLEYLFLFSKILSLGVLGSQKLILCLFQALMVLEQGLKVLFVQLLLALQLRHFHFESGFMLVAFTGSDSFYSR